MYTLVDPDEDEPIVDLDLPQLPIEIDSEDRKSLRGQSPTQVPRVFRQAPDVVDEHDAGMRSAVGSNEEPQLHILLSHASEYTRPP